MAVRVDADLTFELAREGQAPVRGHLRGADNRLQLEVDDPGAFAGARDASGVRALAEQLASNGVVVRVVHDGTHLVTFGAVSAPWWQRRATGSRRIRLGSLRGAWTAARSRARGGDPVLPDASLLPPPTLWPPAPTFARRRRRRISTTHDPARGGAARLVLLKQDQWAGESLPVFLLRDGMTIGSGDDCGIRLPGLAATHAVVRHDDADDWVLRAVDGPVRAHGAPVSEQVLSTGTRISLGVHELGYYREEHADHGRPHGGREGGEWGHQRPQAPRPSR